MKKITRHVKFVCPITRQLINEIAITSDGFFYEKSAIEQWLKNNNTSPQTGLIIDKKTYPCFALQNQLEDFYNNNPLSKAKRFQKSKAHADNLDEINNIIINGEYIKLLNYNEFNWVLFGGLNLMKLMKNIYINRDVITHIINNTTNLECEIDNDKWRPIHFVCRYQSIDAIKLLVDSRVDLECKTNNKWRPIHFVCKYQSIDAIKLFVDNLVNLECEGSNKWRPIHFVCRYQLIEAIKLLVDNSVDLECEIASKWRPIHFVCRYQSIDAIKLIVDNGVNLGVRIEKYVYQSDQENSLQLACNFDVLMLVLLNPEWNINEKEEMTMLIQSYIESYTKSNIK